MLKFSKISGIADIQKIKKYIDESGSYFSTWSGATFLMWRKAYPKEYCIYNDTLIIREFNPGDALGPYFYMPIGKDVQGAVKMVEDYCRSNSAPLVFANLTEEEASLFSEKYDLCDTSYDRNWSDYIYLSSDMRTFRGKKFSGQRNHINKFKKLYGSYEYHEMTGESMPCVIAFLEDFGKSRSFVTDDEREEFLKTFELLEHMDSLDAFGGYITVGGEIVAISVGEIREDMLFVIAEKANRSFEGAYQVMVQEFAKHHTNDDIKYINREDDMGMEGLRTSKLQYHPIEIKHKYYAVVKTLFHSIIPPVEISGKRIVLNDICESDGDSFLKLCADAQNNKYWGYDCRKDSSFTPTAQYFLDFVNALKSRCEEYSLAIRYEGHFIGEVVLHGFDYSCGVELGVRLLPDYQGMGLGSEAVECAADYAAAIGAKAVKMKCFLQNTASYNMIKKVGFKETCRDETYIYFEK